MAYPIPPLAPRCVAARRKDVRPGLFFFFFPTLVSSAIKADSVLRQQRPRGMYSKVSLTNGWDAGKAVLHRGRAQWGRRTCMYCKLDAGGGDVRPGLCALL